MKKALYIFTGLIATVVTILFILGRFYLPRYLANLESKFIEEAAQTGYDISYDDLTWSILSPGISVSNLNVARYNNPIAYDITDTLRSNAMQLSELDSIFLFSVETVKVRLRLRDVLWGNFLSIADFKAHNGGLVVLNSALFFKGPAEDDAEKTDSTARKRKDKENLKIAGFTIKNITYEVRDKPTSLQLDTFQGSLFVDRQKEGLSISIPGENVVLEVSKISMETLFPLHGLSIDSVSYSMSTSQIKATGLNIRPNQNRAIINYEQPYMITHTSVSAPEVVGTGFTWTFSETFAFRLQHLVLDRLFLNLYQNMEKPIANKKKSLPTAWIDGMNLDFLIDSVQVRNGKLNYTETRTSETLNPANFWMDSWNLIWTGYGTNENRPESHKVSSDMIMMDGAPVRVTIDFPYEARNYGFFVKGSVTETMFEVFNPVLEPLEGFHFKSGVLKEARFSFDANDIRSSGVLFIKFDDVAIGLSREPRFRHRVMGWAANRFVIQNDTDGESIEVEIGIERDQNRSFANFLAQTMKSGLVDALLK